MLMPDGSHLSGKGAANDGSNQFTLSHPLPTPDLPLVAVTSGNPRWRWQI
jgi:hypothetical protein